MATRKTEIKRFMRALPKPKISLRLLLQDVEDPVNVGAIFRLADACKVEELVLSGITAKPPHKLISRVGRNKHTRVKWRYVESAVEAVKEQQADGFQVYATEITHRAQLYHQVEYAPKTCLMVGHEDHGVTKKALEVVDHEIFLPMYGKGASLNVHMALCIAAYHVLHSA